MSESSESHQLSNKSLKIPLSGRVSLSDPVVERGQYRRIGVAQWCDTTEESVEGGSFLCGTGSGLELGFLIGRISTAGEPQRR